MKNQPSIDETEKMISKRYPGNRLIDILGRFGLRSYAAGALDTPVEYSADVFREAIVDLSKRLIIVMHTTEGLSEKAINQVLADMSIDASKVGDNKYER